MVAHPQLGKGSTHNPHPHCGQVSQRNRYISAPCPELKSNCWPVVTVITRAFSHTQWTHRVRSGPAGWPWAGSGRVSENLRPTGRPTRPETTAGRRSRSPPTEGHRQSAFASLCREPLSSWWPPCWLFIKLSGLKAPRSCDTSESLPPPNGGEGNLSDCDAKVSLL